MKQLADLQHTFQNCVLVPSKDTPPTWVSASGRATPETQVSIYAHAYRARLKEVLGNDFPAVLMAISNEQFDTLAEDYIEAHPSHYFSLRDFGCHMPTFIPQHSAYNDMPWLNELAIFEWTLGQAFDAADVNIVTEQDMATIPPEAWPDLKFVIHPSVRRLDFVWNTVEMWKTLTDENPTPIDAVRGETVPWLIWREHLTTRFRSLEADEQCALDKLQEGASFNEICEELAKSINDDEVPLRAASLLKGWIAQGLISEISSTGS